MLVEEKGIQEVYLSVSHHLGMAIARERLQELHATHHLQRVTVTNSIPQPADFAQQPFVTVQDLSHIFSRAINRIHYNQPTGDSLYRTPAGGAGSRRHNRVDTIA